MYRRKILEALKLMKLDMVNFTIAQCRPYVQQHSIDYEKQKFRSLLEIQKGKTLLLITASTLINPVFPVCVCKLLQC